MVVNIVCGVMCLSSMQKHQIWSFRGAIILHVTLQAHKKQKPVKILLCLST